MACKKVLKEMALCINKVSQKQSKREKKQEVNHKRKDKYYERRYED